MNTINCSTIQSIGDATKVILSQSFLVGTESTVVSASTVQISTVEGEVVRGGMEGGSPAH